jgi:AcrR family transcriptional regulator
MTEPNAALAADLPEYLWQLWTGAEIDRPGPKRGVDMAKIGVTGMRIADTSGLSAVSMRNIAGELGFTPMALYRYVRSKDDLISVIIDTAYGTPGLSSADTAGWRDQLAAWAQANRNVLLAHPWILQVPLNEPPLTPNLIMWMESGLSALAHTALKHQEKLSALLLVEVYVRGQANLSNQFSGPGGPNDPSAAGLYSRRLGQLIGLKPERFPEITAAVASGSLDDDPADFAVDEFTFGLRTVLDGIAARIAARPQR